MNKEDKTAVLLAILLAALMMVFCTGCRSVKIVTEYRDREVVRLELQHDSIYQHDSVFIAQRGDTVYRDRVRTEYAFRYITRVDSFIQRDSIPYPVEIEKVVTKNSVLARFALWWLWLSVVAVLIFVGWRIFRRYYLHI